jgi:hypothetical protein
MLMPVQDEKLNMAAAMLTPEKDAWFLWQVPWGNASRKCQREFVSHGLKRGRGVTKLGMNVGEEAIEKYGWEHLADVGVEHANAVVFYLVLDVLMTLLQQMKYLWLAEIVKLMILNNQSSMKLLSEEAPTSLDMFSMTRRVFATPIYGAFYSGILFLPCGKTESCSLFATPIYCSFFLYL